MSEETKGKPGRKIEALVLRGIGLGEAKKVKKGETVKLSKEMFDHFESIGAVKKV